MPDIFLTTSGIYSFAFGILFGLVIVPFVRFPRSWTSFVILLLVNAAIPYLSATEILTRVKGSFVVHLSLFLTGAVLMLNLGFVAVQVWRAVRSSEEAVGEPT